ncbi:MAG: arginine--tRNA ligase [Bacilli bacterium]|nr:arginine--tRNA ligase [Bacilli bacterium]
MSIIKELNKRVNELVKDLDFDEELSIVTSARPDLGDFQINNSMNLAKKLQKNPREIAESIVKELEKDETLKDINIAGPGFINFSLTDEFFEEVINRIGDNIENNIDKVSSKKIIMDYGGANVSKALHVGHLRSANIGEALKRLARLLGCDVISDAHLGDFGRPLGLVILEIKKRFPDLEFFNENYEGNYNNIDLPITNADLEEIYPYASTKAKEDEIYLEEAREITLKLQKHEKGYYELWQKIIGISKEDIKKVYDELNVDFDLWEGESDAAEYIEDTIKVFEDKNLIKESEGAKIIEVKKEDDKLPMPPLLLVKSNETVSYETTDLATIYERMKNFNPDEIWYLTDERQTLHFEQVFRAARLGEIVNNNTVLEFIPFGTMNGKDGKPFKTRDGGVMTLKELMKLIYVETDKRINEEIVEENKREQTAKDIAISSLKFADLLPFRRTDYVFDPDKFADLDGKTGAYLLYSTIRIKSLLNKAEGIDYEKITKISGEADRKIMLMLLEMPKVLEKAYSVKSLNDICEYVYNLIATYNSFYAENKIITCPDKDLQTSWLALSSVVYKTVILLLDILGMNIPEKM